MITYGEIRLKISKQRLFFTVLLSSILLFSGCSSKKSVKKSAAIESNPNGVQNETPTTTVTEVNWGDSFKLSISAPSKVIKGEAFNVAVVIKSAASNSNPYKGN